MINFRIRYERLRKRLESRRRRIAVLRSLWLAALPLAALVAARFIGVSTPSLRGVGVAAAVVLLAALLLLSRPAPLSALGHFLDTRFGLDDLIVTALEVDRRGAGSQMDVALLDDAAMALAEIERRPGLYEGALGREAETLLAVLSMVAGFWLLGSPNSRSGIQPLAPVVMPGSEGASAEVAFEEDAASDSPLASGAPTPTPERSLADAAGVPETVRFTAEGREAPLPSMPGAIGGRPVDAESDDQSSGNQPGPSGPEASTSTAGQERIAWELRETVRRYFEAAP